MKGKRKIRKRKWKGFVARCYFHTPAWSEAYSLQSRHFTFRRAESGWPCCPGVLGASRPSPAQHPWGGTPGCCSSGPCAHQAGAGTTPCSTPRLWGTNLVPLHANRQPQAPLGETDTLPIGRSWKKALCSSPPRQFDSLNMPQTDCPCQLLLVQYVA